MKRAITWVSGLKTTAIIIAIVMVVLGAYFVFAQNGAGNDELFVVTKGDFTKQVFVSGTVKATQSVELGFAQGGRVSGVYAKVGDKVSRNALLAEIENGDLRAQVLQRQAAFESEEAKLLSLKQGTRPEEVSVSQSEVAKNEAALEQTRQELVNVIRDVFDVSDDALRNQVDQFISNPRSNNPQIVFFVLDSGAENALETGRVKVGSELGAWEKSLTLLTIESDLTKAQLEAKQNLLAVNSILAEASTALSQAVPNQTSTEASVKEWVIDITAARTALNAAISSLTDVVTRNKGAESTLEISRKNLTLALAGSTQADIDTQVAKVKAAQADIQNARSQLLKTLIVAPFTGVVTKMESKVGAVASSNVSDIALISEGAFQIESYVPEVDIAEVEVGDVARATLDAYGDGVIFDTKIISIDPAETIRDGVSTYKTVLQFITQDPRIKSGMTANVIITTEKKTDVISLPQRVVETKADGTRIVQVKEGGVVSDREVVTGKISSLGQIEIISGLQVGDVVVLTESK